ncbi:hypothetical protein [Helicobacter turcicus]|uniref:hypothetical protein n=1 Tax=Helicobacter turcicus TaxID=2867412 RepID=UPI001C887FA2|nr:hypothetical protein [Helicobacter turcicus]MBX7545935.1 hypothetical protein [Helicobacter turcicus]
MQLLHSKFTNCAGAQKYFHRLIQIYNNYYNNDKIKVAICLRGAFRGYYQHCFKGVLDLAQSLEADIFVSTWNKTFCYHGFAGAAGNFVHRNYPSLINDCPDFINHKTKLFAHFPNVFKVLDNEISEPLFPNEFVRFQNVKGVNLNDDKKFEKTLHKHMQQVLYPSKHAKETHLETYFRNTNKEYFLLAQGRKMILEHENKFQFKYDYIINLRADQEPPRNFTRCELFKIRKNEIASKLFDGGFSSLEFYGHRNAMLSFMDLYNFDKKQNLKFFKTMFLTGGIHDLLTNWCILNQLIIVPSRLQCPIDSKYHVSYLPNFQDALDKDIKTTKLDSIQLQSCIDFFNKIRDLVQKNSKEALNKGSYAKNRVYNYLNYKLGAAIIRNYNVSGIIKLPFILSKIAIQHKKEQLRLKRHLEKTGFRTPKFQAIQSYPDYKEAQKLKSHLAYKLGLCVTKTFKNPYNIPLVFMLPFKLLKIKKDHISKK